MLSASRIFSPEPLVKLEFPTKTFRFDINPTGWSSWYEIDAVAITGDVAAVPVAAYKAPAPKTLAGDLLALFEAQSGDVTFETPTGEQVKAHMAILAARCPVILKSHDLLIRVPDHVVILRTVLNFIYTDTADLPVELAVPVYVAASRWGLDNLAALAVKVFRSALNAGSVFGILQFVDGIPELRQACIEYLAAHPRLLLPSKSRLTYSCPAQLSDRYLHRWREQARSFCDSAGPACREACPQCLQGLVLLSTLLCLSFGAKHKNRLLRCRYMSQDARRGTDGKRSTRGCVYAEPNHPGWPCRCIGHAWLAVKHVRCVLSLD